VLDERRDREDFFEQLLGPSLAAQSQFLDTARRGSNCVEDIVRNRAELKAVKQLPVKCF
jgi:hypothetical protein